jgi:hypothetical protein
MRQVCGSDCNNRESLLLSNLGNLLSKIDGFCRMGGSNSNKVRIGKEILQRQLDFTVLSPLDGFFFMSSAFSPANQPCPYEFSCLQMESPNLP